MNICFVYKSYPIDGNYDSGIGRYLLDLTSELTKKNKITIVTTSNKPRIIKGKNLTIYAFKYPNHTQKSLSFINHLINIAARLPKIIKENNIEIIEFANWESEGFLFTALVNKFLNKPIVIRLHTPSVIDHKYLGGSVYFSEKLKEHVEKLFVNQEGNFLTSSTKFNAYECKKVYSMNKDINIIPLGIKAKKNVNRPQQTMDHPLNVLFVGRLERRKGIDILIEAIPKVLSKNKNFKFLIVGQENNNHGWITKLRNSIQYNYLNNVNFLGYIASPKTLDRIYKNSNICVIPSRYESFGLVILDALNHQKAVIANKVGGIPEILDNNTAILISADSNNLANSILKLSEKSILTGISKNGKQLINMKFNSVLMAKNTLNFYSRVIHDKL